MSQPDPDPIANHLDHLGRRFDRSPPIAQPEGYVLVQVKQLAQWREWANNVAAWSKQADRSSEVARLKASISNAMISATQPTASNAGEREAGLVSWLTERRDNCRRIAKTKNGQDAEGWMEDASLFEATRAAIASKSQKVPDGYQLVMVPKLAPGDEPDWNECIRQAEEATGIKVERHTLSIVIREVRRWLATKPPAGEQKPVAQDVVRTDRMVCGYPDCGCPTETPCLRGLPPARTRGEQGGAV